MQYSGSSFRYAVIHDRSLCIMLMSSLAKRAIKHDRLVCIGGVKLAGFGRVSFDAIIHAAITPTDNKGRLELSSRESQFSRAFYKQILSLRKRAPKARGSRRRRAPSLPGEGGWSLGRGVPIPSRLEVWGSVVSSPSKVRGGAPAAKEFVEFYM